MKNLSLVINAILLAAVIVLYVLFFTGKEKKSDNIFRTADTSDVPVSQQGIVYINIDSVLIDYEMYKDLSTEFEGKIKSSEARLSSQQRQLQKEAEDFQYKIDRGLVTRAEAADLQQQLAQKEQQLYQLQSNLQMQLAEEQQVAQRKVINSIVVYLEKLGESGDNQYEYVLGSTFGGNVLYAKRDKNITRVVVKGLNDQYLKEKAQKK